MTWGRAKSFAPESNLGQHLSADRQQIRLKGWNTNEVLFPTSEFCPFEAWYSWFLQNGIKNTLVRCSIALGAMFPFFMGLTRAFVFMLSQTHMYGIQLLWTPLKMLNVHWSAQENSIYGVYCCVTRGRKYSARNESSRFIHSWTDRFCVLPSCVTLIIGNNSYLFCCSTACVSVNVFWFWFWRFAQESFWKWQ